MNTKEKHGTFWSKRNPLKKNRRGKNTKTGTLAEERLKGKRCLSKGAPMRGRGLKLEIRWGEVGQSSRYKRRTVGA